MKTIIISFENHKTLLKSEVPTRESRKSWHQRMAFENHENHEKLEFSIDNYENHDNPRIAREHNENH